MAQKKDIFVLKQYFDFKIQIFCLDELRKISKNDKYYFDHLKCAKSMLSIDFKVGDKIFGYKILSNLSKA